MMKRNIFKFWFKQSQKLRFLLVGGFNTIVSYLMFFCFLKILGNNYYQLSLFLSWIMSSVISFFTQKIFVWQTVGNYIKEYVKCLISWSIGYLINALVLEIFVKLLKLDASTGQIIAIFITTIITYILFKKFVFKRGKKCQK